MLPACPIEGFEPAPEWQTFECKRCAVIATAEKMPSIKQLARSLLTCAERHSTAAADTIVPGTYVKFVRAIDRLRRAPFALVGGLAAFGSHDDPAKISRSAENQCCSASPLRQPDSTQISYARSRMQSDKFRSMGNPIPYFRSAPARLSGSCPGFWSVRWSVSDSLQACKYSRSLLDGR